MILLIWTSPCTEKDELRDLIKRPATSQSDILCGMCVYEDTELSLRRALTERCRARIWGLSQDSIDCDHSLQQHCRCGVLPESPEQWFLPVAA